LRDTTSFGALTPHDTLLAMMMAAKSAKRTVAQASGFWNASARGGSVYSICDGGAASERQ